MTIKDLSRETGYSVGTISRVLNKHPSVSEKARREITEAIARSGFERNENAKKLKQQKNEGILVLVKGRKNELFAAIIERLQQFFDRTSYTMMLDYFDEQEDEARRAVHLCAVKKPQGILFLGGNCKNFRISFPQVHIPAVLLTDNAAELRFPNLSSVFTDDVAAADCAVSYLIAQGHRRIGVIGGDPAVSDTSRMRLEGCLRAMRRSGIKGPVARESALYSYEGGYNTTQRILAADAGITALFSMADVMAIGAVRALKDAGYRVPEDISVCGFDGLPLSDFFLPQLTTVRQSADELADHGARLLLESIEHPGTVRHEVIPFSLAKRESVRSLPTDITQQKA